MTSNGSGIAEADFEATMHPGDNFKVAASGDPNALADIRVDGTDLEDSSNNSLPLTKVKGTPMLTVWRRINLEVDNMGAVGTNNHILGTVTNAVHSGGNTVCDVSITLDPHRFKPGKIDPARLQRKDVIDNTATTVTISGQQNLSKLINETFTLYDDDDYDSDNPWAADEDEASIASLNSLSKMQTSDSANSNVYAPGLPPGMLETLQMRIAQEFFRDSMVP